MRSDLYERVKYIASKAAGSQASLGDMLGINRRTFEGYLRKDRENSLWPLLSQILELYPHVQRDWLYFGEGTPFTRESSSSEACDISLHSPTDEKFRLSSTSKLSPLPMVGFASCGPEGWSKVMHVSVSASPIMLSPNAIAVIATGDSMVPAGIASGQVCYCDPDQIPLSGDVVYLVRHGNQATIRIYLGAADKAGWVRLKGWSDKEKTHGPEKGERHAIYMDIPESEVLSIAPVIYVRRRF